VVQIRTRDTETTRRAKLKAVLYPLVFGEYHVLVRIYKVVTT